MGILETKRKEFQESVRNSPKKPGCYMYKDKTGKIIYIGKAKNLFNRVRSYFLNYEKLELRIQQMIDLADDVEYLIVDSDIESIILETNLIKKYTPKYNILMRDDKSYSYIMFEKQIKGKNDFPRIRITRDNSEPNAEYFGPFPSRLPLKNILRRARKVFPYASCNRVLIQQSDNPLEIATNNSVPCLYFHLGLCNAPCASKESREDYMKNFNSIKKIFKGEKLEIINELEDKMKEYSDLKDYESAAEVRDRIEDIRYVTKRIKIDNNVDDVVVSGLVEAARENGINELIEKLKFPSNVLSNHKGFRIECYDISNFQGTNPVGAMTVLIDGELRPEFYRHFKIQSKDTPDDFGMLQEVMERRLKYLVDEKDKLRDVSLKQMPDLIIIDGGKGQLGATFLILKMFGLDKKIPIVGLAKREEEIFKLNHQFEQYKEGLSEAQIKLIPKFSRVMLPRRSESLFIVQRIRDEAHRFGITFHRKLRTKSLDLT
jgi:excinuclease ABC subunit C